MTHKFIIIPTDSIEQLIFLVDYEFWAQQEFELKKWCDQNNASFKGMTVAFPNAKILSLFLLRWS